MNSPSQLGIQGIEAIELVDERGSKLYRARQSWPDRVVAVKIIDPIARPLMPKRLDPRRRALTRFAEHTGVMPVYEAGVSAQGDRYLIMPFYSRGSLADRLDPDRLPWPCAVELVVDAAEIVATAHDLRMGLGDLRPSRILVAEDDTPVIALYGMSAQPTSSAGPFVAPEADGRSPSAPPADVYSLSAVLVALLSGRPPVPPESPLDLLDELDAAGSSHAAVPRPVLNVIEQGLARAPGSRPPDARALGRALAAASVEADSDRSTQTESASGPAARLLDRPARTTGNPSPILSRILALPPPRTRPQTEVASSTAAASLPARNELDDGEAGGRWPPDPADIHSTGEASSLFPPIDEDPVVDGSEDGPTVGSTGTNGPPETSPITQALPLLASGTTQPIPLSSPDDESIPFVSHQGSSTPSAAISPAPDTQVQELIETVRLGWFNRRRSLGGMAAAVGFAALAGIVTALIVQDLRRPPIESASATTTFAAGQEGAAGVPAIPTLAGTTPLGAGEPDGAVEATTAPTTSTTAPPSTETAPRVEIAPEGPSSPLIRNARISRLRPTSAQVRFDSPVCVTATFTYGPTGGPSRTIGEGDDCSTAHALLLGVVTAPLEPGTAYTVVITANRDGSSATTSLSFTTLG
jgi:hypothetical protein